jgi:hypothetical protein
MLGSKAEPATLCGLWPVACGLWHLFAIGEP